MASSVSPVTSQPTTPTSNSSTSNSLSSAPSESVFLNLLVAQIQNQDPLNPTDSTQFVSQLAQFSELEQVIAIRGDTDSMAGEMKTAAASSTSAPTTPAAGTESASTTPPSSGQDPTNTTTQA
jgi:flagellar basal-body rod modification protein FlgD